MGTLGLRAGEVSLRRVATSVPSAAEKGEMDRVDELEDILPSVGQLGRRLPILLVLTKVPEISGALEAEEVGTWGEGVLSLVTVPVLALWMWTPRLVEVAGEAETVLWLQRPLWAFCLQTGVSGDEVVWCLGLDAWFHLSGERCLGVVGGGWPLLCVDPVCSHCRVGLCPYHTRYREGAGDEQGTGT